MPGLRSVRWRSPANAGAVTLNQYGIRRVTLPRVRTTKPVVSRSAAAAGTCSDTGSVPGTDTDAGAAGETSPVWRVTVTFHAPAPPPASVSARSVRYDRPRRAGPNGTVVG